MTQEILIAEQPGIAFFSDHYRERVCGQNGIALFYEFSAVRSQPAKLPIITDVCIDLIFYRNELTGQTGVYLYGPPKKPYEMTFEGRRSYFGVRFISGFSPRLGNFRMPEIIGEVVPVCRESAMKELVLAVSKDWSFDAQIRNFLNSYKMLSCDLQRTCPQELCAAVIRYALESPATLTLEKLERITGYSRQYLNRVFNANVGYSVMNFVKILRVQNAVTLWLSGQDDIVSIAADTGYCDQSHLIREFKKYVGQTPGKYRRLLNLREGSRLR